MSLNRKKITIHAQVAQDLFHLNNNVYLLGFSKCLEISEFNKAACLTVTHFQGHTHTRAHTDTNF